MSNKEQPICEHIKEGELKRVRTIKRAKAIAAATVVKHHPAKRLSTKTSRTGFLPLDTEGKRS